MKKLEEENKINSYMVSEKLPKELEAMRHRVRYLQKMTTEPAMGQADVQELEEKVRPCFKTTITTPLCSNL